MFIKCLLHTLYSQKKTQTLPGIKLVPNKCKLKKNICTIFRNKGGDTFSKIMNPNPCYL